MEATSTWERALVTWTAVACTVIAGTWAAVLNCAASAAHQALRKKGGYVDLTNSLQLQGSQIALDCLSASADADV